MIRESALRAAVDLIARQGCAATSMSQVAEAAGISPSGLAHHFPSKKALLGAVLEHRDAIDSDPSPAPGTVPWCAFDHLVEVAGLNMQRRQIVQLYTTMIGEAVSPDHPAHAWMLGHYDAVHTNLAAGVRADQANGHIRTDAPAEQIAREVVAIMDGLQVQWLLDESVDMKAILHMRVEQLKTVWGTAPRD